MRTFNNDLPPMSTTRSGYAAATHDGQIFVLGGYNNKKKITAEAEVYNVATKQWSAIESMGTKRCYAAAVSFNGNIVVIGGHGENGTLSSAEQYSLITNQWKSFQYSPITKQWTSFQWTPFPPMNTPRQGCAAAVVDGKIIVVGGSGRDFDDGYLASAEEYDPSTGLWSEIPPMTFKRGNCAAAVLDGQLYVMGGRKDGVNTLSSVEVYNSTTKQWTVINDMTTPRTACAAVAVGGRIIVIGGYNYIGERRGNNCLSSCESYDPETQKWSPIASMHNKRVGCAAVEVDGTIFVIGGHDGREWCYHLSTMESLPYSAFFTYLLDEKPEIAKELGINDTTMPTFLSFVDQNCRLLTLWKVIRNRQDLLTI